MAASYTWPAGLPQSPQRGFTETGGILILRTPTDSGVAKLRRRGKKPSNMSLDFIMTTAEVSTFLTFVETTIKGTARFNFPHPRTGSTVEARIIPKEDGSMYTSTYLVPGYWNIQFNLEVLP